MTKDATELDAEDVAAEPVDEVEAPTTPKLVNAWDRQPGGIQVPDETGTVSNP